MSANAAASCSCIISAAAAAGRMLSLVRRGRRRRGSRSDRVLPQPSASAEMAWQISVRLVSSVRALRARVSECSSWLRTRPALAALRGQASMAPPPPTPTDSTINPSPTPPNTPTRCVQVVPPPPGNTQESAACRKTESAPEKWRSRVSSRTAGIDARTAA